MELQQILMGNTHYFTAGEYTLTFSVGYQTIEVSEVLIKSDEVEQVDVTLSTNTLDEIIITTTVENTESAVLDIQKVIVMLMDFHHKELKKLSKQYSQ